MTQLKMLISALFQNKVKFFVMIFSAIIFALLIFPFDDLGDLVTSQVAKLTNNQVFVQFDRMKMGVLPNPGLQLQNVYLETASLPPLSANELIFRPSIAGLIAQKPSGTVIANGFLKGDITISLQPGKKSDNGVERQKIDLSAQHLNLADMKQLANLPVTLKGRLDINSQALADLTLNEQPDMDLVVHIEKFELPSGNVQTMMGPLTLPEIKLTTVDLKGRLSAGRFNIEEGTLGKDGDELKGTIRGGIAVQLKMTPQGVTPLIGAYDFTIDLQIKKGLQDRATLFLSFLDQYKSPMADGARYAFKVSAPSIDLPPSVGALR